jgi:cytochrome P450
MAILIFAGAFGAAYLLHLLSRAFSSWIQSRKFAQAHRCEAPPNERPWDYLGLIKTYETVAFLIQRRMLPSMTAAFEHYGTTYFTTVLGSRVVITCEPENIRQILIDRFVDYDASKGLRDHLFRPLMPSSIFALDGDAWKSARHMFRGVFSNTRAIIDIATFERVYQDMQKQIPTSGTTIDFQRLSNDYTNEAMICFVLGESAHVFNSTSPPEMRNFLDCMKYVKAKIASDGFLGPAHIFTSKRRYNESCAYIQRFIDGKVRSRLARKNEGPREEQKIDSAYCLLDSLIQNSEQCSDVRDALLTILVAGIDSVSSLLSATFWLLSRHPTEYQRLREEILGVVDRQQVPTYDQLKKLTFLRYVLNESKSSIDLSADLSV